MKFSIVGFIMAENKSIYETVPKTQSKKDEEKLRKRNEKAMKKDSSSLTNQNNGEVIPESTGIIKRRLLETDEEKKRKEKESLRLQQEERNVGLRINDNGDTVTKQGKMIQDRQSQPRRKTFPKARRRAKMSRQSKRK